LLETVLNFASITIFASFAPFTRSSPSGGFLLAGRFQFLKSENQIAGPTHGIEIFVARLDRESLFIKIDR
jgi:hypothetical protein